MTLPKISRALLITAALFIYNCSDDGIVDPNTSSYLNGSGTVNIRSYVLKDKLFPFIPDSAVAVVEAPDMEPVTKTLKF